MNDPTAVSKTTQSRPFSSICLSSPTFDHSGSSAALIRCDPREAED